MAPKQQRLFQRREAVGLTRTSVAQRHSAQAELWLGRAEFDELIRPPRAGTVEVSRPDVKTTTTPVLTTAGPCGLAGSDVRAPAQSQVPQRTVLTRIPPRSADLPRRQGRSRRFTRFAAAGALALVGGAASVPLITSHNGSITATAVGNPAPAAPVVAIPAPDPNTPFGGDPNAAPIAAPSKPADGPTPPAAAVHAPQTVRSTIRSRPPATMMAPPARRAPAIPPEAYAAWSRLAALSARDQDRTHFRSEAPPHP